MPDRTFDVTVCEAPSRVLVEAVRTGHCGSARDLVGTRKQDAGSLQPPAGVDSSAATLREPARAAR